MAYWRVICRYSKVRRAISASRNSYLRPMGVTPTLRGCIMKSSGSNSPFPHPPFLSQLYFVRALSYLRFHFYPCYVRASLHLWHLRAIRLIFALLPCWRKRGTKRYITRALANRQPRVLREKLRLERYGQRDIRVTFVSSRERSWRSQILILSA